MIIVKILMGLITVGLCAQLWWMGGEYKNRWRDVLIPIVLGAYVGFISFPALRWFCVLLGVGISGTYQIMRLGYGRTDPQDKKPSWLSTIIHDTSGEKIQAAHGFLTASVGSLPAAIHTQNWLFYVIYVAVNTGARYLLTKAGVSVGFDNRIVGALVGSIVFIYLGR